MSAGAITGYLASSGWGWTRASGGDKYTLAYDLRRNKPDWTSGHWAKASEQARDRLDAAIRNWLNPDMPNAFPRFRRKAIHMTCFLLCGLREAGQASHTDTEAGLGQNARVTQV